MKVLICPSWSKYDWLVNDARDNPHIDVVNKNIGMRSG